VAEPARKTLSVPETIPLRSRRFGDHEIPADRVLSFPAGLVGFPSARRFALLEPARADSPFRCLVCLDVPELGFVVCEPEALWPGYLAEVPLPDGAQVADVVGLAIVTIPGDPTAMTANLMAPLVIHCATRTGWQLVLDTGRYAVRQPLLAPAETR
jgi:flagellar assembly factor FliW